MFQLTRHIPTLGINGCIKIVRFAILIPVLRKYKLYMPLLIKCEKTSIELANVPISVLLCFARYTCIRETQLGKEHCYFLIFSEAIT